MALMAMLGLLQVIIPVCDAVTPVGVSISCVTITWLVDKQPLAGLITVKTYVPGVVTEVTGVVAITPTPLLQL